MRKIGVFVGCLAVVAFDAADRAPDGLEAAAGRYAWVCHLHASAGMVHEFTVE